jgi:hypothetical protein
MVERLHRLAGREGNGGGNGSTDAASARTAQWSVLAYNVADGPRGELSSLDRAVAAEIKTICDAADQSQVNVAVQVDFQNTPGIFRATVTRRADDSHDHGFRPFRPSGHRLWDEIAEKSHFTDLFVAKDQRELDSASSDVLDNFITFGRNRCATPHYMLFFYGHALGPRGMFADPDPRHPEKVSLLRLPDLARAISPTDVIMFRDCLMGTIEAVYQLRGAAKYLIASQGLVPISGRWPWPLIMSALNQAGSADDVAEALFWVMASYFNDPENRRAGQHVLSDVPCALIDVDATATIIEPFKELVDHLDASRRDRHLCEVYQRAFEEAAKDNGSADRPGDRSLIDLSLLCENLRRTHIDPVSALAADIAEKLKSIVRLHHSQNDLHHGLSIFYWPPTFRHSRGTVVSEEEQFDIVSCYRELAFSSRTGWNRLALNPLNCEQ